jgi:hypothetical protein
LLQGFSNAEDRPQVVLKGRPDFEVNQGVGLAKKLPTLGMAQDNIVTQALQHERGDFSGERPGLFKVHILRTDFDGRTPDGIPDSGQGDEGRAEDNLYSPGRANPVTHPFRQVSGLSQVLVHFPVSGNNGNRHYFTLNKL